MNWLCDGALAGPRPGARARLRASLLEESGCGARVAPGDKTGDMKVWDATVDELAAV
jgi:hypothetical protein